MKGSSAALVLMAVLATAQLAVGRAEAESAGGSTVGAPAVSPNRLELEGFSILPPQGDGWQRLSSNGVAHLLLGFDVLYVKAVSPTELSHAYVVAHRVRATPRIRESWKIHSRDSSSREARRR
jgi:hypothetical protein